ncbi:ABC transporter permease [Methylophilus sp. YYY-1]|uniref:ABC transporter permease n=1 Tax=Methylophilus sp. YYY-1 TaxID=2682087 RepID=UPI0023B24304|nr:ABC transporter permease [Methylophilus sp. YYY-1]MDF0377972.1 ABC transporter permease [Methylophilus sp. YYY-1]
MVEYSGIACFGQRLKSTLAIGFNDIKRAISKLDLVLFFAWGDTKARYRRSALGPIWMIISTSVSVAGLGFLWSMLLKQDSATFIPSLTIGLVSWQFISGCILESCSIFVRNSHFIRNIENPYTLFPLQLVAKHLINLTHSFIVIVVVLFIFHQHISIGQLLFIPGLMLVIANLLWISILLGIWGARFRDIEQIVSAMMPIIFFISPVIYRPNLLEVSQQAIVWLNPFSYLLALIRDPLIGASINPFVYEVGCVAALVGWSFVIYSLGKNKGSISFWV